MSRRSAIAASLASAAAYALLAIWQMRAVLVAPFERLPFSAPFYDIGARYGFHDLKMVASQIAYNARTLATSPAEVLTGPQCYPIDNASTFGEHMLGQGVMGVLPHWILGDPLVAMTASVVVKPLIAALAAYWLVLRWTRSPGAAFLAGLLFGFHPVRLIDPAHPYLSGNEWTMLGVLALDAILAGGGWAWTALFVGVATFQLLESFYPLLGFAFVVGVFGLWRLAGTSVPLSRIVPKLVVAALALAAVVYVVLGPYLATREIWPVLSDRAVYVLNPLSKYQPGALLFLGVTFLGLVVVGLVDLLRRPRASWPRDPRWPLLVGGMIAFWFGVQDEIPVVGGTVPALYHFLRWLPGVDAVRSPAVVTYAGLVPAAVFAGYGASAILAGRSLAWRRAVVSLLGLLWVAELFTPLSTVVFGARLDASPVVVRPPEDLLALHERLPDGPLLNLPWARGRSGPYLLLSAYHHRRIVSCYNSFEAPHVARIRALAEAVPDPGAVRSLAALGIESVVVHDDVWAPPEIRARLSEVAASSPGAVAHLEPVGAVTGHQAFTVQTAEIPLTEIAALRARPSATIEVSAGDSTSFEFTFENPTDRTFRHPFPIQPRLLVLRWVAAGKTVLQSTSRAMLPLVLVPGEFESVEVASAVPAPGAYEVILSSAHEPDVPIATRHVRVVAQSAGGHSR